MSELRDRLRVLDGLPAPDLWPEISSREVRPEPRTPVLRRIGVAALAAVLFGAAAFVVVRAFGGAPVHPTRRASTPPLMAGVPVSASTVTADGRFRCTVRLPSGVLRPGENTGATFSVQNLTGTSQEITPGPARFTMRDASQGLVWDSDQIFERMVGGPTPPFTLAPHATAGLVTADTVVAWIGPLTLNASCPVPSDPTKVNLPPLRLKVALPGEAPDANQAFGSALEASGGLFAHCRPQASGAWVTGYLAIPGQRGEVPRLPARCAAQVVEGQGFDIVTFLFVSPPKAPSITLPAVPFARIQLSGLVPLPPHTALEAGRWEFVASANGARPFALESAWQTRRSGGSSPSFWYRDGRWVPARGSPHCGGLFYLSEINIITACPA